MAPSLRALALVPLVLACSETTSPSPSGTTDAAAAEAATPPAADAAPTPPALSPPDPGVVRCGSTTCATPDQVCCYSSVAPGGPPDHCEPVGKCAAPSIACDETADCKAGELCCTGTAVLPRDAGVRGFSAASCVPKDAPSSCKPEPGVGKSSVQACKGDAECLNGQACAASDCFGRVQSTCGPNAQCR